MASPVAAALELLMEHKVVEVQPEQVALMVVAVVVGFHKLPVLMLLALVALFVSSGVLVEFAELHPPHQLMWVHK